MRDRQDRLCGYSYRSVCIASSHKGTGPCLAIVVMATVITVTVYVATPLDV